MLKEANEPNGVDAAEKPPIDGLGVAPAIRAHHVPQHVDVRAIRRKLGLSQNDFAARFGFSLAAVREWEQGRRRPEQAARTLMLVIDRHPDVVEAALENAAEEALVPA